MTRRPIAVLFGLAALWILWAYSYETSDGRRMPGTWTRVLTADSEGACERNKRDQVLSLLNALASLGASVDRTGETIFYTVKARDGRPILKGTRYYCFPDNVDPSGGGQ
ncbi:hypothetical protein [Nitrospira sp. Kam-Ns4a]